METTGQEQPPAFTPPAPAGVPAPARRRGWPTVIGVVSIVLGAVGVLCYGCNSLQTIASPFMAGVAPQGQQPVVVQGVHLVVMVVTVCASWALSAWLLVIGIGLCGRRGWARGNAIGWSVAKILVAILSTAAAVLFAPQTIQQVNDQLSAQGIGWTLTVPIVVAFSVLSMFWLLIWPTFLLAWFARSAVRKEVEGWRAEARVV